MVWLAAAVAVFLACAFSAQTIARRSLLGLTAEDKARLVDTAATTSRGWSVAMLGLYAVWFAAVYAFRPILAPVTIAVLASVLALSVLGARSTYRQLEAKGVSPAFLKSFVVSRGLRIAGAIVFFGGIGVYAIRVLAG
jgi:hypothetical protein